jgi:hypothetical protein
MIALNRLIEEFCCYGAHQDLNNTHWAAPEMQLMLFMQNSNLLPVMFANRAFHIVRTNGEQVYLS